MINTFISCQSNLKINHRMDGWIDEWFHFQLLFMLDLKNQNESRLSLDEERNDI